MTPLLPNVIPIHTHILVNCAHLLYIHLYSHRSNMKHSRETFDMKDGMYWTHVPFWSTCTSLEDLEIRYYTPLHSWMKYCTFYSTTIIWKAGTFQSKTCNNDNNNNNHNNHNNNNTDNDKWTTFDTTQCKTLLRTKPVVCKLWTVYSWGGRHIK